MHLQSEKVEATQREPTRLVLSPSIRQVLGHVGAKKPITASKLMQTILESHNEYGAHSAASVELEDTTAVRTADEWVSAARELFDEEAIRSVWKLETRAHFHGRLLIVGLCLLEPRLLRQLESVGAFTAVVNELLEPLDEILTDEGRTLYDKLRKRKEQPDLLDTVPNWSDDPVVDPDQDLLGRAAFARFLAKRIAVIPEDSYAYSIHIYAPWGAGKSTLLNFLRLELEPQEDKGPLLARVWSFLRKVLGRRHSSRKKDEWIVVEFNAWRNQQIQPPWWSLMERIFKHTKNRLTPWNRFMEFWWRFKSGRLHYFVAAILLAWLFPFVLPWLSTQAGTGDLEAFGKSAESVSKILALVATVWGAIFAINRSLLFGSARAARNYTEMARDPTSEIRRRFDDLIKRLRPKRVAVFIDDLDRCQSRYVVELLEGIQTLFRQAFVVFVIAADRRWLNACYEDVYGKLESRIREPGKPLGTLFLEKAFRFSTPMPGIPEKLKEYYWQHLLKVTTNGWRDDIAAARQNARKVLRDAQSENEVRKLVKTSHTRSFTEQRALREEAAVKLAAPELIERIEHTLKPYANLLEPNPRGMKLLVNGYSANRALAMLAEVEIDLHQLALWTILSLRWPQLAEYLMRHADMLEQINEGDLTKLPKEFSALWVDPTLDQVLRGGPTSIALTSETLKQSVRIQS